MKANITAKCIKTLYTTDGASGDVNEDPSFIEGETYVWKYDEDCDEYNTTNEKYLLHCTDDVNGGFFKEYFEIVSSSVESVLQINFTEDEIKQILVNYGDEDAIEYLDIDNICAEDVKWAILNH